MNRDRCSRTHFITSKQAIETSVRPKVTYAEALGITEDPSSGSLRTCWRTRRRHEEVLLRRYAEFKAKLGL